MAPASDAFVAGVEPLTDPGRRADGSLEAPGAGPVPGSPFTLDLAGWVVGRSAPAERVEVLDRGRPIFSMPVSGRRPDVAAAFPGSEGAETSGFVGTLSALRAPREFELALTAVLTDGASVPVALVRGRRAALRPSRAEGPQPLAITTLGRTGSTWLSWLLGGHPAVFSYWPFGSDTRAGHYWMSTLQGLADPSSSLRQLFSQEPPSTTGALHNPGLERWLCDQNVLELAELTSARVHALYAALGADASTRYFVEKQSPHEVTADLLAELFPGAREVVLIRDLRDVVCSMREFTAKRGGRGFGRELVSSDEEHIEMLRAMAQELLDHWNARRDRAWLVRYEDLIEDPVPTLQPLLGFLGLDQAPAEEMVAAASAEFTEGMAQHITAPDPQASVGRWRRDLEPSLVEQSEAALGPIQKAFGY